MSEKIDFGSHRLRVRDDAPLVGPSGTPFLCLHGLADTLDVWEPLLPRLRARARVVRFDQRGHGESDAPSGPYSREALAEEAVTVLDRLHVARAVLVGHSMGGVVAMSAALAHPDRVAGLVLLGTTSECNAKTAAWYEDLARLAEEEGLDALARAIFGRRSSRRIHGDAAGLAHVTRMLASLHARPLTPRLATLDRPALVVVGERDPMGTRASERIRDALPRASFETLESVGHWSQSEAPERLADRLDAWLDSTAGGSHAREAPVS